MSDHLHFDVSHLFDAHPPPCGLVQAKGYTFMIRPVQMGFLADHAHFEPSTQL